MKRTPTFIVIRDGTIDTARVMAAFALRIADRRLPVYSSHDTSRRFTQPQLLACLVLKAYLGCNYRTIAQTLECSPGLRHVLGLRHVPHYYTLKRFEERASPGNIVTDVSVEAARKLIRFGHWARRPVAT